MGRRVRERIEVEVGGGKPAGFIWHDQDYTVADVLDWSREAGQWWYGGPQIDIYKVIDNWGRVFELHRLSVSLSPLANVEHADYPYWILDTVED